MAFLYVVATPIGNLKDITIRALEILKSSEIVLCENIERTKKLLDFYKIEGKILLRYHQHSKLKDTQKILNFLKEGKILALVCDAGTPGISDPGGKLIEFLLENVKENELRIVPIPGPSAITTLLSVSGISADRFLFLGFLPKKKKRKKFLERIFEGKEPKIFFESPFRILKTLKEINQMAKEKNLKIFSIVGKELTKFHEKIYRGSLEKVIEELQKDKIKGEYIVCLKTIS
jgi:16S rRNA (cytidine1402-2'-O)-methyltransferase